jgi:hypothetical protein
MKGKFQNPETFQSKKLYIPLSLWTAKGIQEDSTAILINQSRRRQNLGVSAHLLDENAPPIKILESAHTDSCIAFGAPWCRQCGPEGFRPR